MALEQNYFISDGRLIFNSDIDFYDLKHFISKIENPSEIRICDLSECKKIRSYSYIGFNNCGYSNLETIILPQNLEILENNSFYSEKIKYISLPSSVKTLSENCFNNCENLEFIDLSFLHLTRIPKYFLKDCKRLKLIKLPETLEYLEVGSFECCENLEDISLPRTLKTIDEDCFRDTKKLKTINLPDNLLEIRDHAFTRSGIKILKLPNNLEFFGIQLFTHFNLVDMSSCHKIKNIDHFNLKADVVYLPPELESFTTKNAFLSIKNLFGPKTLTEINIPKLVGNFWCYSSKIKSFANFKCVNFNWSNLCIPEKWNKMYSKLLELENNNTDILCTDPILYYFWD